MPEPETDNITQREPANIEGSSSNIDNSSGVGRFFFAEEFRRTLSNTLNYPACIGVQFIAVVLVLLIILGVPIYNILTNYNTLLDRQISSLPHIDNWDKRIIELEKRLQLLTTKSIDGRLQNVESLLAAGNFNKEEFQNVQQISTELKKIKSDLYISPERIGEFRELQYKFDIFEQKMENKISETKTTLMWFIMASICLPFILIIVSPWLQRRFSKENPTRPIE